ncbi:MAG: neutral zinc metallopeptidase [Pseudomonadales bacterium]|nr:neutral zinc metallopeptidase [Pseudomonadales bacterium]
MKWRGLRRSANVEDRRGQRAVRGGASGLRLPIGGKGGLGIVAVLVVAYLLGGPELVMNLLGGGGVQTPAAVETQPTRAGSRAPVADEGGDFISAILGSTEDAWGALFDQGGARYQPPILVLFTDAVASACGYNSAAVGPFYCPPDQKLYIDLSFFSELARMGGAGDFAQAYVVGHEVGHHVQNLMGTARSVRARPQQTDQQGANRLQVAMELQADCYAGVWAHHANRDQTLLEPGDVAEGLAAAAAIGDDTLQRNAGRRVTPEAFTHGTSAQRQSWLERGLKTGDPSACDTFAAR